MKYDDEKDAPSSRMGLIVYGLAILAIVFSGCSSNGGLHFKTAQEKRLDALTSFSASLSKRDYAGAVRRLDQKDQARILDDSGRVPEAMQARLAALNLSTLYRSPLILVSGGRITGIPDVLPVLGQASAAELEEKMAEDSMYADPQTAPTATSEKSPDEQLRLASESFFRSVRARNWTQALNYVAPDEKKVFVSGKGTLRPGTRRRLSAADTSAWDSMILKDGKLTGVVLIVPPLSTITE